MKTDRFLCIILIEAILFSGCASTTLFRTSPESSDVYISGSKKGETPFYYTDRKTIGSSTLITFRKNGYNDLNVKLKRNEALDIGPFIGGLVVLVPWLWLTQYDSVHTYQLVLSDVEKQVGTGIVYHTDSAMALNELALNENDSLKKEPEITKQTTQLNDSSISLENDSLKFPNSDSNHEYNSRKSISHFGFGGGFCLPGSVWGINYAFLSKSLWGGSIRLNMNIYKSKTVPSDYYSDGKRVFAPKDYLNTVSFNLVKSFNSNKKSMRYGFELGPSWVIYRKAEFELNSGYDPSSDYIYNGYLYEKSHPRNNTLGLSLRGKMEFLVTENTRFELSAFTCINKYKSVFGIEMDIMFGNMGYKR